MAGAAVRDADAAQWQPAIDALVFRPSGHRGVCAIHRLAFRALLGRTGGAEDCLAFFAAHRPAFERAAAAKIARRGLDASASLHLTSRDVARAIAAG
ncbi:DUF1488 family protein [Azospirillum agricola]|uniref:DUF1488 family protein n=1 Tax=Azospirillum agricola TaxID=1720247 RepID=UPI000A1C9BB0|nr:DUF1488 family protein [Azospirillum agricola]